MARGGAEVFDGRGVRNTRCMSRWRLEFSSSEGKGCVKGGFSSIRLLFAMACRISFNLWILFFLGGSCSFVSGHALHFSVPLLQVADRGIEFCRKSCVGISRYPR